MTRYELLQLNKSLLNTLVENNVSPSEVRKMEIYEEFCSMKEAKHKVTYIVTYLATRHGMKERAIYTLIRRFESDIRL